MVSFIASLIITAVMLAIVLRFAKRRQPGRPLTWGEAFVAATFLFALMLMAYGVVPDQWLRWADGGLKWRSDKIGIPTGPIPVGKHHLLFEDGLSFFGRGRILLTAQVLRDIVATLIYVVFLVGQCVGWLWWQNRGKRATERPAIATSAYGRPLVRKA
jgi:hypothetical protein